MCLVSNKTSNPMLERDAVNGVTLSSTICAPRI